MSSTRWRNAGKALGLDALDAAFGDDIGALPVIAAIEHDHHAAGLDVAESLRRCRSASRERRNQSTSIGAPIILAGQARLSRARVEWRPSQATTRSARTVKRRRPGVLRDDADDAAALLDQIDRFGLHPAGRSRDSAAPAPERKFRKSHCGIIAMNLHTVGRWRKSTISIAIRADLAR